MCKLGVAGAFSLLGYFNGNLCLIEAITCIFSYKFGATRRVSWGAIEQVVVADYLRLGSYVLLRVLLRNDLGHAPIKAIVVVFQDILHLRSSRINGLEPLLSLIHFG